MLPSKHSHLLCGLVSLIVAIVCCAAFSAAAEPDQLAMYFDDSQMVEVATRAPKPITQVAESVSVISADEIASMHAHSVAEVLQGVMGIFVDRVGSEFNGTNYIFMQGSQRPQVLILLDGVRRNSSLVLQDDLKGIPLAIIDRIEIIRGPASSVWGSSLGGVINIITKKTGTSSRPSGTVTASYGERGVGEYNMDMAGRAGRLGYFLYAGRQDSDGLLDNRYYGDDRFYSKFDLDLPHHSTLTASAGLSDPHLRTGDFALGMPSWPDFSQTLVDRTKFVTMSYDTLINDTLHINLAVHRFERTVIDSEEIIPGTQTGIPGDPLYETDWGEKNTGVSLSGDYRLANHQFAFGGELNRGQMGSVTDYGEWAQSNLGLPALDISRTAYEEVRGIYLNDTIVLGRWSIIPGIRYDQHSISDDFVSPSLGATCRITDETLLRGVISRGFTFPILSYIAGGRIFDAPNPDLKPESITSWQLGVESVALHFVTLKGDIFLHNVEDSWSYNAAAFQWYNAGKDQRQGVEMEAGSLPWHHLSLAANCTYVYEKTYDERDNDNTTAVNLLLRYNDREAWKGELRGQYTWWNSQIYTAGSDYRDNNIIWDLGLSRTVNGLNSHPADLFIKARNLFNAAHYTDANLPDPGRWLEAGIAQHF
jgi:vitamin B12 transporter